MALRIWFLPNDCANGLAIERASISFAPSKARSARTDENMNIGSLSKPVDRMLRTLTMIKNGRERSPLRGCQTRYRADFCQPAHFSHQPASWRRAPADLA